MADKANYVVVYQDDTTVCIRDVGPWDRHLTVTNDAERVVDELCVALNGRKLIYYDSDGELATLRVIDGKFAGFA